MQIDKEEIGSIAIRVQEKMIDDPLLKRDKTYAPYKYYAVMQKRIWKEAYKACLFCSVG